MDRPYNTRTQTEYLSFKDAGRQTGILGLNEANCTQHGIVIPTTDDQPTVTVNQVATLADQPTENPDGTWSRKWAVRDKTDQERPTRRDIKRERDRRLEGDFEFNGVMFQRDSKSLDRITGAATLAGFAIAQGAQPGNFRWANPNRDFGWIASDDSVVLMDAQTAFQFGQVAANVETSLIYAAKALREMNPIPFDFKDDKWWTA